MSSTTSRPAVRRLAFALLVGAAVLGLAGPVAASTPAHGRITKGDVTAAFQARTTGGYVNGLKGNIIAAPVRGLRDGRINPFWNSTLCDADWHYLGVTLLGDGSQTTAATFLRGVSITYAIDRVPVGGTIRTAIKPFVGTGIRNQWGVSVGKLVAPGSIAPGDHLLHTEITAPGSATMALDVTFTLSPDACA